MVTTTSFSLSSVLLRSMWWVILFLCLSSCPSLILLMSPVPCCAQDYVPSANGTVTLRIWVTEIDASRVRAIQYLTTAYEALRDGVHVELVTLDENMFARALETSLKNGTAPDLVGSASELIMSFGEKGYLDQPATAAVIARIGKNRFFKGPLALLESREEGKYWGIPFHGWIQGIWYREDWFKREGLAPPDTWKAILKAAQVFTDPDKGTYGILVGTGKDYYAAQVFTHLAISNSARMLDASGNVVFDNPRMVETLEFYRQLARYSPPGDQTWRARDYYLQGRLAMMFYSTFIMDDLALPGVAADSLTNRNFAELPGTVFDPQLVSKTRMVPLVTNRRTAGYGMVNALGIVRSDIHSGKRNSAVDAVSMDFLEYLYSPDVYISWLHMAPGGMMPVFRDIAGEDAFMRDLTGVFRRYGRPKVREINLGLERISNFSQVQGIHQPVASVVYADNILPEMIHKALSGKMSCEQAVQWADTRIREVAQIRKGIKRDARGGRIPASD